MKPRISVLTLAVADLERSVAFYQEGLGLPTEGIVGKEFEYGAVAFFQLDNGLTLALWPKTSLAKDTGLTLKASYHLEFTIRLRLASWREVDEVMERTVQSRP